MKPRYWPRLDLLFEKRLLLHTNFFSITAPGLIICPELPGMGFLSGALSFCEKADDRSVHRSVTAEHIYTRHVLLLDLRVKNFRLSSLVSCPRK